MRQLTWCCAVGVLAWAAGCGLEARTEESQGELAAPPRIDDEPCPTGYKFWDGACHPTCGGAAHVACPGSGEDSCCYDDPTNPNNASTVGLCGWSCIPGNAACAPGPYVRCMDRDDPVGQWR